jgi:REP element-mobilizing transposase RayT
MSHSFNKIWIHATWATKERQALIKFDFESKVHQFLTEQLREQGCPVRIVNGMPDHIHALFLLNPQKSVSDVIKQIKGSCSHFINQQDFISEKFAWQTGYASFSVSESIVERVFNYIKNQKAHHQNKTYREEYDELIKSQGFDG